MAFSVASWALTLRSRRPARKAAQAPQLHVRARAEMNGSQFVSLRLEALFSGLYRPRPLRPPRRSALECVCVTRIHPRLFVQRPRRPFLLPPASLGDASRYHPSSALHRPWPVHSSVVSCRSRFRFRFGSLVASSAYFQTLFSLPSSPNPRFEGTACKLRLQVPRRLRRRAAPQAER